jgi:hypothetical protein
MKMSFVFPVLLQALLLAFASALSAAEGSGKPVALSDGKTMRTGTLIREKMEISVNGGKTKQEIGKDITELNTRFLRRINLMRRLIGGDAEEVELREFHQDSGHFTGLTPPAEANVLPNNLAAQTLRVRKKSGRWSYDLLRGTASPQDRKLLDEMAFTADLLEILPACMGVGSRKIGETWRTELSAPRGKAYGWVVPEKLESTLLSVEEKPEGSLATVTISGKFKMERPMNFNARMEITFSATVVRRLSDMLDVDTKISGQFVTVAAAITEKREPIILNYDYPFTLVRTLKIEDK